MREIKIFVGGFLATVGLLGLVIILLGAIAIQEWDVTLPYILGVMAGVGGLLMHESPINGQTPVKTKE